MVVIEPAKGYDDPYQNAGAYPGGSTMYNNSNNNNSYGQPAAGYDPYAPPQNNTYGGTYPPGTTTYTGGGYTDEPRPELPTMPSSVTAFEAPSGSRTPHYSKSKLTKPNEKDPEDAFYESRQVGSVGTWRQDTRGNLWTKGSRVGCVARFACCTFLMTVLMLMSIILTLALYVRPPDITFQGLETPSSGSTVEVQTNGLKINLNLAIGVANPNFFAASFEKISASAIYPINNTAVGGGSKASVVFPAHSNTQFLFPFSIVYTNAIDPDHAVILDLVNRCGFTGNTPQNIVIDYRLTLKIKILIATISPAFSGSASFACPLSESDISGLVGGLNIPGLNGNSGT